jgi:hypothetical protein
MDMNDDDFFLVLPSNVSRKDSLVNEISKYRTYLPSPLEFSSSWEVGIVEINYPHSWANISGTYRGITFLYYDIMLHEPSVTQRPTEKHEKQLPEEYYNNIEELIENFDNLKPRWFEGHLRLRTKKAQRGYLQVTLPPGYGISFNKNLAEILGFRNGTMQNPRWCYAASMEKGLLSEGDYKKQYTQVFNAQEKPDIRAYTYNIYVYSNIIKKVFVGNYFVPLLRTVPIANQPDEYIHHTFVRPYYIPINQNFIEYIDIQLCDSLGELMKFKWGRIIITLHFRKKRHRII